MRGCMCSSARRIWAISNAPRNSTARCSISSTASPEAAASGLHAGRRPGIAFQASRHPSSAEGGKMLSCLDHGRAALAAAMLLAFTAPNGAAADPVADFYAGKQITFIVGSDPGGGYDAQARLVAKHLQRFIPGNPVFIVQNMPGAGSVLMSNRIANTAAKDGTFIGLPQRGILLSQLTAQPGIQYDVGKFNWIGSIANETLVMLVRKDVPADSAEDMLTKEIVVGGTGATSDAESLARLLNATIGSKLKIVSGYAGSSDVMLAVERRELQGGALPWANVELK